MTADSIDADVRAGWAALAEEADNLRAHLREFPVATASRPADLRAEVERRFPLEAPMTFPELVREAASWSISTQRRTSFGPST